MSDSATSPVRHKVPADFSDRSEHEQIGWLQATLCEPFNLSVALDLECDLCPAQAIPDIVTIFSARLTSDSIRIGYCVEFSEFRACLLEHHRWKFERWLIGRRLSDHLEFQPFQPTPRRSTADEL